MTPDSNPSVIVVDDDDAVREAMESLLRSSGWRVTGFASAEDFLRSASPRGVGCLILDINLPGMSGLELQRHLVRGEWQSVPVIFITAHSDRDGRMRQQAMQGGARAFLSKPFLDDVLLDAVRSATAG